MLVIRADPTVRKDMASQWCNISESFFMISLSVQEGSNMHKPSVELYTRAISEKSWNFGCLIMFIESIFFSPPLVVTNQQPYKLVPSRRWGLCFLAFMMGIPSSSLPCFLHLGRTWHVLLPLLCVVLFFACQIPLQQALHALPQHLISTCACITVSN